MLLPSDLCFELVMINFKSFLNYMSVNKSLHQLLLNELRPRICHHIIQPLCHLNPRNKTLHPHDYWKENIKTVWIYYYAINHDKHVTFSFGENSSLLRYRTYELINMTLNNFPHYTTNTRHRTKEYANPGYYESDCYDEYGELPYWVRTKRHYINVYIKIKRPNTQLQQITMK